MTEESIDGRMRRIVIDAIVIVCKGCGRTADYRPDAPLVGAAQLKEWLDSNLVRCVCDAPKCDVHCHLADDVN